MPFTPEELEAQEDAREARKAAMMRDEGDDFHAVYHGSIVTLTPLSPDAKDWCRDNLPDDAMMFGDAYAIEPRYFGAIAFGIQSEGFTANFRAEER